MGKPYGQRYCNAATSKHGEMRCGGCSKPIVSGEYRVAQKSANHDWHYVTHHRECCASDPAWSKRETEVARRAVRDGQLLAACKAFKAKWSVDDLDELIDDLTPEPVIEDEADDDYDWASPADMGAQ